MVILPVSDTTTESFHDSEPEGQHGWDATCIEVTSGGTITPAEDTCYELHFDLSATDSMYTIDASGTPAIVIFAQHFPTEFERDTHYLYDASGADVEGLGGYFQLSFGGETTELIAWDALADGDGSVKAALEKLLRLLYDRLASSFEPDVVSALSTAAHCTRKPSSICSRWRTCMPSGNDDATTSFSQFTSPAVPAASPSDSEVNALVSEVAGTVSS